MKFGVIGYGRFGKLWAKCLKQFGTVVVHDAHISEDPDDEEINFVKLADVCDVDFLFLAIPVRHIEVVCKQIAPLLAQNTVVVDVCAVKEYPSSVMQKHLPQDQSIIATHPLFGPDSVRRSQLAGQKMVVHLVRGEKECLEKLEEVLKVLKLHIINATPAEHDRQMAYSHALVHFLGRSLTSLGLKKQEIATPDYETLLDMNTMVENDTWELFLDMQCYNKYAAEMRKKLIASIQDVEQKISV